MSKEEEKTISMRKVGGPGSRAGPDAASDTVRQISHTGPGHSGRFSRISRRFGRFELLMELASGGMATLYLARLRGPQQFEKLVAIKIIHPHLSKDSKFVDMFFDEARISALLQHPNVVHIFDLGSVDGSHFIAMEYIHGRDLRATLEKTVIDWRARGEPAATTREWSAACRIVASAAAGLHAAHELRSPAGEPLELVHRDVSPHNILISYEGHVKLTDFGIAYAKHRLSHTDSGILKGKLGYMSPEQADGRRLDRRADTFSLGVVLWEALCLKRLFKRETRGATLRLVTEARAPAPSSVRPELPARLDDIVLKALARRPERRFQTAKEMQKELEALIAGHGVPIGASELGTMMVDLFVEEKPALDSQISAAIEGEGEEDVTRPFFAESGTESRVSAQVHATPRVAERRGIGLPAAILAALVPLMMVAGYFLLKKKPAAQKTTVVRAPAKPRPGRDTRRRPDTMASAPGKLLLILKIAPKAAKATIIFRGKKYVQNRLDLLVTAGEKTEPVEVHAPGYHPLKHHVTVRKGAKLEHELRLRPKRKARPVYRPLMRYPRRRAGGSYMPADIGLDD